MCASFHFYECSFVLLAGSEKRVAYVIRPAFDVPTDKGQQRHSMCPVDTPSSTY